MSTVICASASSSPCRRNFTASPVSTNTVSAATVPLSDSRSATVLNNQLPVLLTKSNTGGPSVSKLVAAAAALGRQQHSCVLSASDGTNFIQASAPQSDHMNISDKSQSTSPKTLANTSTIKVLVAGAELKLAIKSKETVDFSISHDSDFDSNKKSFHLDIAQTPMPDFIALLASHLQDIVRINDQKLPILSKSKSLNPKDPEFIANANPLMAFYAKNIPSISISSYLKRIIKYCPVSNDVFLSLLIYFDRIQAIHAPKSDHDKQTKRSELPESYLMSKSQSSHSFLKELPSLDRNTEHSPNIPEKSDTHDELNKYHKYNNLLHEINSYNVHRFIIAGITVASKFLSDIFYTNSRYARVGGLPLAELDYLELQFLLLLDFRLYIALEVMQSYADNLLGICQYKQE